MTTSFLRHRGLRTGFGVVAILLVGWFGGRSCSVPTGPEDDDTASASPGVSDESEAAPTTTGPSPPSGGEGRSAGPEDDGSEPPPIPSADGSPTDPGERDDSGPDDTAPPPPTTEASTTTTTAPVEDEFTWELPLGDTTIQASEAALYNELLAGSCDAAQRFLTQSWRTLKNPRAVLLYQAAIYFCADMPERGRALFDQAAATYGWEAIVTPYIDCQVYQAVRSVLEQKEPASFRCTGGERLRWPDGLPEDQRVDPRTSS